MNLVGATGGADYVDSVLVPSGSAMSFQFEVSGEGDNGSISVSNSISPTSPVTGHTLYYVTNVYVMNGTHQMAVYRCTAFSGNNCTTTTQVGSTISVSDKGGSHQVGTFAIGITGQEGQTYGYNVWIDNVTVNTSGTFPLGP